MEKIKENYDRVLLIVIGLITLVAGSMLIMKSFAVSDKFPGVEVGDGDAIPESPIDKVTDAAAHVDADKQWVPRFATDSEKRYRLFASIPIVNKDGAPKPIDLFDESTPVREGVTNKYIMEHNLPYKRNDVLSLDLDGDGFSNLEEFELGGTDPRDKNDYPDATHKLQVEEVTKQDYLVMFSSQAGGVDFNVKRIDPPGGPRLDRDERWSVWVKQGQSFPDTGEELNRFKALKYEEKDVHSAATSQQKSNIGVLTVEDSSISKPIELVKSTKTNIPIFRVKFTYEGPGSSGPDLKDKEFEKGDTFKLDGTDLEIEVTKVTEEAVELKSTNAAGKSKTITRTVSAPVKPAEIPAPPVTPEPTPTDPATPTEPSAPETSPAPFTTE